MKELIYVSDLDGTFSKIKSWLEDNGKPFYIITGCQNKKIVENKLKKIKGVNCLGWWCYNGKPEEDLDVHLRKIVLWKAKMVRKLKADYYIDDDHRVLKEVSKLNPKTTCLLVF